MLLFLYGRKKILLVVHKIPVSFCLGGTYFAIPKDYTGDQHNICAVVHTYMKHVTNFKKKNCLR